MLQADRKRLREALLEIADWLTHDTFGPTNVDAGLCDQCGHLPRLVTTCGPQAPGAVCRACLTELGEGAWCSGHRDEAERASSWMGRLPDDWPTIVVAWWISTGEIRPQGPVARAIPASERSW